MIETRYRSHLPQIAAEIERRLDEVARDAANTIAAGAKARVPVSTGALKAAIHVDRRGEREYAVVAGDDTAFYGLMVEFGTSNAPAHPFLIPSGEMERADYETNAKKMVDQVIAREST